MTDNDSSLTAAERAFAARAGRLLREDADALDGATASRLNRARQRAVAELAPRGVLGGLVPALAAAAVGTIAVAVWLALPAPATPPATPVAAVAAGDPADVDVLLADDSLEMIQDLDFYAWMDPALDDAALQAELETTG